MRGLELARRRTPTTPVLDEPSVLVELDDPSHRIRCRAWVLPSMPLGDEDVPIRCGDDITRLVEQRVAAVAGPEPVGEQGRYVDMSPPVVAEPVEVPRQQVPDERGAPAPAASALETRLNPKYTFETFVIGSSNRFPHAAAVAVAVGPRPGPRHQPPFPYVLLQTKRVQQTKS